MKSRVFQWLFFTFLRLVPNRCQVGTAAISEIDGFRAIGPKGWTCRATWSRNQKNFARRFPGIVKALAGLPGDIVIDGDLVVLK
jgi:ATP-dependent DNA ligase